MEESSSGNSAERALKDKFVLQFLAANGFQVVLEFGNALEMEECGKKIEGAGLAWSRLPEFNPKFDQADLYMDMRSPVCRAQFDLEDWI
ncbi:MAG: hypothetical protein JSU88_08130 [Nitrospinaceae bacterium]|jgi:hypothetical protein|nr:MAG: hypothetical protein JSU88_08130 [Nitrospinaceae bacterium]